jgi:two-component system, NtrC family, sensor histidine kinase HydH
MRSWQTFRASQGRIARSDQLLWLLCLLLAGTVLLHYLGERQVLPAHAIYTHLSFLPVTLIAVRYGWRGGLLAALATTVLALPHIASGLYSLVSTINELLEIGIIWFTALVVGSLVDQQRWQAQQAQRAAATLAQAERVSALGRLAAGIAHEIRNPLAVVRAAAQLLQQNLGNHPEHAEYTNVMQSEADRIDSLIEQLIHYARPQASEPVPLVVSELVERVVSLTHPYAEQHGVILQARNLDETLVVRANPALLHQALVNVVLNAVQATGVGGTVALAAARDCVMQAHIQVVDTGTGIAPEVMEHIFEPFFTTRSDGVGLGLGIVNQIVEWHGGTLDIQSTLGVGTTVTLSLPQTLCS